MIELGVEVEGEKQLSRGLGLIAEDLDDFSKPLSKSSTLLLKTFDQNFRTRGGLFGKWAPRKTIRPWPLLEETGETRYGFISAVTPSRLVIGNTSPKFKYHQSNKPRRKIPRRVMMMIDKQRKTEVVKYFQEFMVGIIRRRI